MKAKDYTAELLKAISDRLSGRSDCKQVEYIVYIESELNGIQIRMFPEYQVYPDTHHRKHTDLCNLIDYIIITRFSDTLYRGLDKYGHAIIEPGILTSGTYQYQLSFDKKSRKWIRIQ